MHILYSELFISLQQVCIQAYNKNKCTQLQIRRIIPMHNGKKIGYGLLSLLPLFLMLLLQVLGIQCIFTAISVYASMQPGMDPSMLDDTVYAYYMEHTAEILIFVQLLTLLVFGCWYYLGFLRRQVRAASKKVFSFRSVAGILLLSHGMYFFVSLLLMAADSLVPDIMAEYNMLMEDNGIGSLTFFSTIATLVLAPLSEELIFRGLTLHYLKKTGLAFWAVNFIQAALFGISHLNPIQGIYAFLLGLVLGWLCKSFKNLTAPMLFHMFFNFAGTYLASLLEAVPESKWHCPLMAAACVVLTFLGVRLLGNKSFPQVDKQ